MTTALSEGPIQMMNSICKTSLISFKLTLELHAFGVIGSFLCSFGLLGNYCSESDHCLFMVEG